MIPFTKPESYLTMKVELFHIKLRKYRKIKDLTPSQ